METEFQKVIILKFKNGICTKKRQEGNFIHHCMLYTTSLIKS